LHTTWWQLAAGGGIATARTRAESNCSTQSVGRVAPPLAANCVLGDGKDKTAGIEKSWNPMNLSPTCPSEQFQYFPNILPIVKMRKHKILPKTSLNFQNGQKLQFHQLFRKTVKLL